MRFFLMEYLHFEQVMVVESVLLFVFHLYLDEIAFDFVIFQMSFQLCFHNDNNSKNFVFILINEKKRIYLHILNFGMTTMVDRVQYLQMQTKVANLSTLMVKQVNQNPLNELVLVKTIFVLEMEKIIIEMMAINHRPKIFYTIE